MCWRCCWRASVTIARGRRCGALSGADAEILLLKYGERWSYREIAERLGITEKAVDARLLRAEARLRHELAELGIDG